MIRVFVEWFLLNPWIDYIDLYKYYTLNLLFSVYLSLLPVPGSEITKITQKNEAWNTSSYLELFK